MKSTGSLSRDSLSELGRYIHAHGGGLPRHVLDPSAKAALGGDEYLDHGLGRLHLAFEELRRWAYPDDQPDWTTLRRLALDALRHRSLTAASAPDEYLLRFGFDFWRYSGPRDLGRRGGQDVSGRVNAIAADPTDPSTLYVGAASGGVWKSTNAGVNWVALSTDWTFEAVSSLAVDPWSPLTIYVGTGDFPNWSQQSFGLLKSTNGGVSFTNLALAEAGEYSISAIVVYPDEPNVVMMTTGRGRQRYGQVWGSNDGGETWTAVVTEAAEWADLAVGLPDESGARQCYAVGWNGSGGLMYRSSNRGASWKKLAVPWGAGQFGISVAPSATDPQSVYVLAGADKKVLFSGSAGENWDDITGDLSQAPWDWDQVFYDSYLRCSSRGGVDILFLGLKHLFGWDAQSRKWTTIPSGHDDQHALLVDPRNTSHVLLGNDGGVWSMTFDPGTQRWSPTSLNEGLGITQIYKAGYTPQNRLFMLEAAQDNGLGWASGDLGHWGQISFASGDEVAAVILPTKSNVQYAAQGVGFHGVFRTSNTWATHNDITPALDGDVANSFSTILVGDGQGQGVYWATDYLWFWDEDAQSWRPRLGGRRLAGGKADSVRAIGVASSNSQRVCTGSSDGQVWAGQGPDWNWEQIDGGQTSLPQRSVSAVSIHPQDPNNVLVGLEGTGTGHVWSCADVTSNARVWTDVSGQGIGVLPDVPVNAIARHPLDPSNRLFVATDVGVLSTVDGGVTWIDLTIPCGLPRVPVKDLAIAGNQLHAATFGRGIWTARLEFTDFAPAAASIGDTMVVVSKGITGRIYICQAKLGHAFSDWREIAGDGRTDAAPAITTVDEVVFIFVKGLNGRVYLNQAPLNANVDAFASSFSGWFEVQGGIRTDASPTAGTIGDHVFVFVKGLNRRVFVNQADYGHAFGAWLEVQGGIRTDASPTAGTIGDHVFVFVKGLNRRVFVNQADYGHAFGDWFEVQGGIRTDAAPAAAVIGQTVFCFVKGLNGRIYLNQADLGHAFGAWFEVQGGGRTDTAVGAGSVSQSLFSFVKGLDGMPYANRADYRHAFSGWFLLSPDSP